MIIAHESNVCICGDLPVKPERPVAGIHQQPAVCFRQQILGCSKCGREDPVFFARFLYSFSPMQWASWDRLPAPDAGGSFGSMPESTSPNTNTWLSPGSGR